MKTTFRNGALALAVIAGSALVAAPAMADHWDHYDKKAWKHDKKAWKHDRYDYDRDYAYRYDHHHHHHHDRYYRGGWRRPGFSINIR
jgi:hypothetical protein